MNIIHHNNGVAPPSPAELTPPYSHPHHKSIFSHVAFYWGKHVEFLFSGWPGNSTGMYVLGIIFVFVLAVLGEWLSELKVIKPGANKIAGAFFRAALHAVRVGLAYMVMLAVMSYNGGIFLAAVLGHAVGYLFFRSRVFKKEG